MHDLEPFARILLVAALALLAAVASRPLAERLRVPAPALFLVLAAVAAYLVPGLGSLSVTVDQRIVTVALVVILFDGGMHIGWARMRTSAGAVLWLGVAGTVVTAAATAAVTRLLTGLDWRTSLLIGAALAPTDPAVVFAVLGRREIAGRSGTLLEGESGANDPVGIALMVSLLGAGGSGWHAVGAGAGEFALQLAVGAGFGVAGGLLLRLVMQHVRLPSETLYPLQAVAGAVLLYAVTTVADGSGFLAVFLAGIAVGDVRAPFKREVERFGGALAALAEIVAFVVLGLSIDLSTVLRADRVWIGVALAGVLVVVIRPLLVGLVTAPIRLSQGERVFVLFGGLKGAVPILLGTYVLAEGVPHAGEVYDIVFVVVLLSVLVQGGLVPSVARRAGVPMRLVEPAPYATGMRFRDEPEGLHRYVVITGSAADGATVGELEVGDRLRVSMLGRDGRLIQVRGDTLLASGDDVLVLAGTDDDPSTLFDRPEATDLPRR